MKTALKFRSPRACVRTYRPRLYRLEDRVQPGSLLLSGLDVSLLGSSLDPASLAAPDAGVRLLSRLHRLTDADTGLGLTVSAGPATASAAPGLSSTSSGGSVGPVGAAAGLSVGSAPANVVPLAGLTAPAPATPAPLSGVASGAPVKGTVGGQALPAPTSSPALTAPVAQQVAAPALQVVPNPQITTEELGGIGPQFTSRFSTFLGGPGTDVYTRVKATSNGLILAGFSSDPADPTGQTINLAVAQVATNGTSATVARVDFGRGVRFFGRGLDVGSDGTLYVTGFTGQNGFNNAGVSNFYVVSIRGDFRAVNWTVGFPSPTVRSAGYGVKLDAAGTNLYYAGDYDLSSQGFPADNLLVGKLTNLHAQTPTSVYSSAFIFQDGNGNLTPSLGNGVGVDSRGFADVVGNVTISGNVEPLEAQVSSNGQAITDAGYFPSVGTAGKGLDITVDAANNYFISGAFTLNGNPNPSFFNAKFTSAGAEVWDFEWTLTTDSGNLPLNAFGTSIKTDSAGNVYDAVTVIDPSSPSTAQVTLDAYKFDSTGGAFLDGTVGALGGSNNDYGLGLDVSGTSTVFLVGGTSSPDFPTTPGVVQPNYGGGPFDGIILGLNLGG